jgi:hypothetical protein
MNGPAIELVKSELFLLGDAERIDDRLTAARTACGG